MPAGVIGGSQYRVGVTFGQPLRVWRLVRPLCLRVCHFTPLRACDRQRRTGPPGPVRLATTAATSRRISRLSGTGESSDQRPNPQLPDPGLQVQASSDNFTGRPSSAARSAANTTLEDSKAVAQSVSGIASFFPMASTNAWNCGSYG